MDWPLTGALAGVTILVGVVGYGTLTLLGSGAPQTTPAPPRPVLLPSRERPAVANVSPIPDIPNAPADTAIRSDPAPGATSDPPHEASSDVIGG
jgi:hypothetical protein